MGMCRKKVVLYEEVSGTLTCAPGIFRLYSSEVFVSFYLPFSIGGFRFFFFLRTRLLAVQSSLERFAFLFSRRTKRKKEKEMQWTRRTRERRGDCSIETWTSSPDVFLRCCVTSSPSAHTKGTCYVHRAITCLPRCWRNHLISMIVTFWLVHSFLFIPEINCLHVGSGGNDIEDVSLVT